MAYEQDLPSSADHCEICGFNDVPETNDPIVITDEAAAVGLFFNEENLVSGVAKEMSLHLAARRIMAAKLCAHCIKSGICKGFQAVPDDLIPGLEKIRKL